MDAWGRELRQALRRLIAAPTFTSAIVLVFATAIGIAAAMFSLATATLEQAAPYEDAGRLVRVYEHNLADGIPEMVGSLPSLRMLREQGGEVFAGLAETHVPLNLTLTLDDTVFRVLGGLASPELFRVLGVEPALGRAFTAAEGDPATTTESVILSDELWRSRFAADPALVGRSITIGAREWTVVGILPRAVPLAPLNAEPIDLWLPLGQTVFALGRDLTHEPRFRAFPSYARLVDGVTNERVAEVMSTISTRLEEEYPDSSGGWTWTTEPLVAAVTRGLSGPIRALIAGATLLLTVALANVIGLFIQRARRTTTTASVRTALGASLGDLRRAALSESLVLTLSGTGLGLAAAAAAIAQRDRWMPFPLPPHIDVSLDARVIAGCFALAVGAAVATGTITANWWWRHGRRTSLRVHRAGSEPSAIASTRAAVAVQIALAAVLSITALLTLTSIVRLTGTETGIRAENLLTVRVDVPAELRADDAVAPTAHEMLDAVAGVPGVNRAALWTPHVPAAAVWFTRVRVFDRPDLQEENDMPSVRIHQVGANAVSVLGLGLVEGRDFNQADETSGQRVALVSETAAREWWGDVSPIGRQIQRWNHDTWSVVVGVVKDAPLAGRQGVGADFFRDVYLLHDQDPLRYLVFLVRAEVADPGLANRVNAALVEAAPDLPSYDITWMEDILSGQERIARGTATLGVVFALAALALIAVGLYAILANVVSQRALEISLRKALGASATRIVEQVTAPIWIIVGAGMAVGVFIAWLALPVLLGNALFGVEPRDLTHYVLAMLTVLAVAVPAVLAPAIRASQRAPAAVLRGGLG